MKVDNHCSWCPAVDLPLSLYALMPAQTCSLKSAPICFTSVDILDCRIAPSWILMGRMVWQMLTTGLTARLTQDFLQLSAFHCLIHHFEFAVNVSLQEVAGCNHFELYFELYSVYHHSAEKTDSKYHIFAIRWVSSSFRTVKDKLKDVFSVSTSFWVRRWGCLDPTLVQQIHQFSF